MSERDLDDLFREFGNDKPYWGSDEWKRDIEKNKKARQIFQDFAKRVKMAEYCDEFETKSQLAALGYTFEPWYADGWHRM
jgi:hypothetical protein